VSELTWDDFPGPSRHQAELDASHEGSPSISVQSATHGAPLPSVDTGTDPGGVVG
jgi:hypothetical protein